MSWLKLIWLGELGGGHILSIKFFFCLMSVASFVAALIQQVKGVGVGVGVRVEVRVGVGVGVGVGLGLQGPTSSASSSSSASCRWPASWPHSSSR